MHSPVTPLGILVSVASIVQNALILYALYRNAPAGILGTSLLHVAVFAIIDVETVVGGTKIFRRRNLGKYVV